MTTKRKPYNDGLPRAKRIEGKRAPGAGPKHKTVHPVKKEDGRWVIQSVAARALNLDVKTIKRLGESGEIETRVKKEYLVKKKVKKDE